MDFVELCTVCTRQVIIKAAKRIFNSDQICPSYCDFYFASLFGTHCMFSCYANSEDFNQFCSLYDVSVMYSVHKF